MTDDYFAGIDVGSLSTDAVILNEEGELLGYSIISTGASSTEAAEAAFEKALDVAGLHRDQIKEVVATGYGRVSVPFAQKRVTEISCHSLGAYTFSRTRVRSLISAARIQRHPCGRKGRS
jgi:activator of 2-hydroxyglutaryl-CoA dehydratase